MDKSFDVSEIKLDNQKNKIISFDIQSHNILNSLKIEHEKVENYLTSDDIKSIDDFSIKLTLKTFRIGKFSNLFLYEEFNLGTLLQESLLIDILIFLKSLIGIKRIIEKEKPTKIQSTDAFISIINFFDTKKVILTFNSLTIPEKSNQYIFPLKFATKSFNFSFSMSFAVKITTLIQSTLSFLFNLKFNFSKKKIDSHTLIMNFSPTAYYNLFDKLGTHENLLLLGDLSPPIWNMKYFKSVYNSKLKIFHLNDLLDKNLEKKIDNITTQMQNSLKKSILDSDFKNIFTIDKINFWPLFEDIFVKLCDETFSQSIKTGELIKELFSKIKIKSVIMLYNGGIDEQTIVHVAEQKKIPCIRIQHGIHAHSSYIKKVLPFQSAPHQKNMNHACWGEVDSTELIDLGIKSSNVFTTGSPRYDDLFNMKNDLTRKKFILIGSTFLQYGWKLSGHDTNLSIKHQQDLLDICKVSSKFTDKKPIIKLHPSVVSQYDVQELLKKNKLSIPIYQTQNITNLIKNSDVVVSMDFSTLIFEAMIQNKPTITFMSNFDWYEDDEIISSQSTIPVKNRSEFETALDRLLNDSKYRNKIIKNGKSFIDSRLSYTGNSSIIFSEKIHDINIKKI